MGGGSAVANIMQQVASQDLTVAAGVAAASLGWTFAVGQLAGNKSTSKTPVISPLLGRKLLHATCAPGFLLSWPLFSNAASARWVAAAVPLLSVLRLLGAGFGVPSLSGLVRAISRSGSRLEALSGPLYYSLVLVAATVFGWRSPVAAVAVTQMAVGDGIADIYGRPFGKTKWPFAKSKSVEGSMAFVLSAFAACLVMIYVFHAAGFTALTVAATWPALLLISILSAAVELLPGKLIDDNIAVPGVAALLAYIMLK